MPVCAQCKRIVSEGLMVKSIGRNICLPCFREKYKHDPLPSEAEGGQAAQQFGNFKPQSPEEGFMQADQLLDRPKVGGGSSGGFYIRGGMPEEEELMQG